MQQAVLQIFPEMQCTYRFKNRTPQMTFTKDCINVYKNAVQRMSPLLSVHSSLIHRMMTYYFHGLVSAQYSLWTLCAIHFEIYQGLLI